MGEPVSIAALPRLKRAAETARAVLRAALDVALPRLCAVCREPVEGEGLCPACWSKLSFISRPYCERLGIPFVYDPGPGILSMEAIAIWRPARPCADDGPLAVASRPRAFGRGGCAGAGAAALAAALGAALHPVGHSRRRRFQGERRADRRPRAQAREIHRPAGRAVAPPARRQYPRRLPGPTRAEVAGR